MTLNELRSGYRALIIETARRYGAHNVRVFGSIARGDQTPSSDVDFLVDFEPARCRRATRTDQLRLLDALEQIDLILKFSENGREAFDSDLLVQSAILHRLALLGEACRSVSAPTGTHIPRCHGPKSLRSRIS
jgi:predicted nucleotidyltransferase